MRQWQTSGPNRKTGRGTKIGEANHNSHNKCCEKCLPVAPLTNAGHHYNGRCLCFRVLGKYFSMEHPSDSFVILLQEHTLRNTLLFTEAQFPSSGSIFEYDYGRRGFRCDHYYEDGSCWGGPDGGGCSKRKKREELVSRPPEDIVNSSRSLSARQKRQTDDVIGCQKESTNGVDYRGRAAETVDGVACLKWTEGVTEGEHNFCRNPNDNPNGVWCNTGPSSVGYCNVPKCDPVITTREASCSDWVGGRAYWKWDYEIPNACQSKFQPCSVHCVI